MLKNAATLTETIPEFNKKNPQGVSDSPSSSGDVGEVGVSYSTAVAVVGVIFS